MLRTALDVMETLPGQGLLLLLPVLLMKWKVWTPCPLALEDTVISGTTTLCTVPLGQCESLPGRNAGEYLNKWQIVNLSMAPP